MRRNVYLWTSGVNLDTAVRFLDPDFLLECKISAIWRRFPLIIAFYILKVCACAKSRDLLKVTWMSYCSRSRRRRFTVLGFKSWPYSRINGHFKQHLYCACAETVIYELPVYILTPPFDSPTPIYCQECKISVIWRRFPLNFAFYMLNVRHISTSGFFDLLT